MCIKLGDKYTMMERDEKILENGIINFAVS